MYPDFISALVFLLTEDAPIITGDTKNEAWKFHECLYPVVQQSWETYEYIGVMAINWVSIYGLPKMWRP